ncbi:hypothetical protein QJQ45_029811, partial [Haematococcus lacustris]
GFYAHMAPTEATWDAVRGEHLKPMWAWQRLDLCDARLSRQLSPPSPLMAKATKAKPAPQPGRWVYRECNAAQNMQRIGESRWRPLDLCYWLDQAALPAKGKEYPGLGSKRLRHRAPKAQQQQPAGAQRMEIEAGKGHAMLINIVTDHFAGAAGCMLPSGALAVLLVYLGGFLHFALSEHRNDDIGGNVVLQACLAMFAQQLMNMPMNASSQQQHIVTELLSVGRTCFRANMTTLIRPIRVLAPTLKSFPVWQQRATEYQALTGIPVVLEGVPFSAAGPEVILELQGSPLRDGWILAPEITGTVALYKGFADLGPLIRQVPESMLHYNDFLPFYRLVSGVYNKKIIGLPMDGDNFLLYYRQAQRVAACSPAALNSACQGAAASCVLACRLDLFQRYQLDVPQTWSDLLDMARLMNGTDTDGDGRPDLFGACLDMMPQCKISFYVAGMAASYIQNNGTQSGFWFDPDSDGSLMRPLMGNTEATRAVLQLLLDLQPYMPRDLTCADSHPAFQAGSCLMTFDWWRPLELCFWPDQGKLPAKGKEYPGLGYKRLRDKPPKAQQQQPAVAQGGVFRATRTSNISRPGMLGIASLPGSTQILDRTTLKLVNCTPALCPMAQPYRTTRVAPNVTRTLPGAWVNTAPYLAFGGWTAGVAASSPPEVQLATLNFFAYLTSPRNSWEDVLNPVGAVDPFRQQHLDPASGWCPTPHNLSPEAGRPAKKREESARHKQNFAAKQKSSAAVQAFKAVLTTGRDRPAAKRKEQMEDPATITQFAAVLNLLKLGRPMTDIEHTPDLLRVLESPTADELLRVLLSVLDDTGLPRALWQQRLVALGTDGASVMVGSHNGLAIKVRRQLAPFSSSQHCAAHRVSLSASVMDKEPCVMQLTRLVDVLNRHFCKSASRTEQYKRVSKQLGLKGQLPGRAVPTRWLSLSQPLQTLTANIKGLVAYMADAEGSVAEGITAQLTDLPTLLAAHGILAVMRRLHRLSLVCQQRDIFVEELAQEVHNTSDSLTTICLTSDSRGYLCIDLAAGAEVAAGEQGAQEQGLQGGEVDGRKEGADALHQLFAVAPTQGRRGWAGPVPESNILHHIAIAKQKLTAAAQAVVQDLRHALWLGGMPRPRQLCTPTTGMPTPVMMTSWSVLRLSSLSDGTEVPPLLSSETLALQQSQIAEVMRDASSRPGMGISQLWQSLSKQPLSMAGWQSSPWATGTRHVLVMMACARTAADIDRWTAAGFDASTTLQYLFALRAAMSSPNLALDTRLAYSLKHSEDRNYRQLLEAAYLSASTAKGNLTNTLKATEENFLQLEKDAVQLLTTADPLELRQQYWYLLGRVASVFAPPSPLPHPQPPGISKDRVAIIAVCLVAGLLLLLGLGMLAWQRVVWLRRHHRSALGKLLPPGAGPDTTLVLTDVQDSTTLYESLPVEVMDACMRIAERIIRDLLAAHQGYESATEGDAFLCAFHSPLDAVLFCLKLQDALLHATWPQELLHCPGVPCCHPVTVSLSPQFNKIVQVLGPPLLPKLPAPQSNSDPDAQQPFFRYTHAETDGPSAALLSTDLSDLWDLSVPAPSSDGLEAGAQGLNPAHLPFAFLGTSQPRDSMTAATAQAIKLGLSLLFHPWMRQPQMLAQDPPPILFTPEDWLARSGALTQDLGTVYSAADTTMSSQALVALGEAGSMASRSSSRPRSTVTSLELAMETSLVDSDRLSSRSSISRNPKPGILCPAAAPTTIITALQQALKISLPPVAELIYIGGQRQLQHRTITSQEPSHCLVFSGLRIRCGVHTGVASAQDVSYNTSSARMQYSGAPLALARAVCDAAQGAQILLSQTCFAALPQQQLRDAMSLAFPLPRASSTSIQGGRAGVVHGTEVDAVGYVDVQHLPQRSLDVQRGGRTTTVYSDCGTSSVLHSVAIQASAAARITNPGTLAVSVDCEMAGGSSTTSTPRPSKPGNAIPVPVPRAKDRQAGAVRGGAGSQHPKAPPLLVWHVGEYVLKVGSAAVARTTPTDGMSTIAPGNQNDTPPTAPPDHWAQSCSSNAIMSSLRDWRQQVAECPSSSIAASALPQPLGQALPQRPELPSRNAVRRSSLALVAAEHCMSPEAAEALHSKPGQQVHSLYSVLPVGLAPRLVLLGAPRAVRQTVPGALSAPYGSACVCFLYVVGLAELLAWDPQEAANALALFSALIKQQLMAWNGYLVEHVDGFVLAAFACPVSALRWACICQEHLKQLPWSNRLLAHPLTESLITAEMGSNGEARQMLVYRGLRIKVGADVGAVRTSLHPVTGVMAFRGRVMNRAARIASRAGSGQVLCSAAVWAHWAGNSMLASDGLPSRAVLGSTPELGSEGEQLLPRLTAVSQGLVPLKGVPEPVEVMQVKDAAVMNVLAIKGVETVKKFVKEAPLPSACTKCAKTPAEGAKFYFRNTCGYYYTQCVDCHNKHCSAKHAAQCANDEGYRARRSAAQAASRAANRAANQKTPRVQATVSAKRFTLIKSNAGRRGISVAEGPVETAAMKQKLLEPCNYCNFVPPDGGTINGLDRFDSQLGYSDANTVACCPTCNMMKGPRPAVEFLQKVRGIAMFRALGVPMAGPRSSLPSATAWQGASEDRLDDFLTADQKQLVLQLVPVFACKVDLWASNCYLCGQSPAFGIDRVDANSPYTPENTRSCCTTCNLMKCRWTLPGFLDHIQFIQAHTQHWLLRDDKDLPTGRGRSATARRPLPAPAPSAHLRNPGRVQRHFIKLQVVQHDLVFSGVKGEFASTRSMPNAGDWPHR